MNRTVVQPGRQLGKTTQAMQAAPQGAVYVWPNCHLIYPKQLAHRLGRSDLEIVSPGWLTHQHIVGNSRKIVLDHATWNSTARHLTREQADALSIAWQREALKVEP